MQQLLVELNNALRDTPQVSNSVSEILNREETLSVSRKVLANNNSDVAQPSGKRGQNLRVFVINMRGKALMPTNPAKARHLLSQRQAKVIRCSPFTIQLTYPTGETKQSITLGVDSGYFHIGLSAITEKQELFSADLRLRGNIVKLISDRGQYRRARRNKLWYREPRFLNRVSTKKKGWLAPSIQHKLGSHIRIVDKIYELLPITKVIIEVANFDIQKIKNPEIKGKEYQEGEQKDFLNIREYVLYRDNHRCQYCDKSNVPLNVHHIESQKVGGSRPANLITLCKKCHKDYHVGKIRLKIKKTNGFKTETFMSIIRWKLINQLQELYNNVNYTFGYLTKQKRINLKLKKSHINDAFCIANGSNQIRVYSYQIMQKRRNNRKLQKNRKGFKPSIRKKRYIYQPQDEVIIEKLKYIIMGVFNYGRWIRVKNFLGIIKNFPITKVSQHIKNGGWQFIFHLKEGGFLPKYR